MCIECSTEDIGEGQDIVDLVRIVGAPRAHQHLGVSCLCLFIRNLGGGVCQGEDNRTLSHRAHHLLRHHPALGESQEDICSAHRIGKRGEVGTCRGELALHLAEVGAVGGDYALGVGHHDMLTLGT